MAALSSALGRTAAGVETAMMASDAPQSSSKQVALEAFTMSLIGDPLSNVASVGRTPATPLTPSQEQPVESASIKFLAGGPPSSSQGGKKDPSDAVSKDYSVADAYVYGSFGVQKNKSVGGKYLRGELTGGAQQGSPSVGRPKEKSLLGSATRPEVPSSTNRDAKEGFEQTLKSHYQLASSQASAGGNGSIINQPIYNNRVRRVSGSTGLNDLVLANEVSMRQHSYELDEEAELDASGMRAVNAAAIALGGSSATAEPGTCTDRDVGRAFESPL